MKREKTTEAVWGLGRHQDHCRNNMPREILPWSGTAVWRECPPQRAIGPSTTLRTFLLMGKKGSCQTLLNKSHQAFAKACPNHGPK